MSIIEYNKDLLIYSFISLFFVLIQHGHFKLISSSAFVNYYINMHMHKRLYESQILYVMKKVTSK